MAQYNGNNAYLSFDGLAFSTYYADEISLEQSAETEDTTHGAGATHIMREPKLNDHSFDIVIIYDVANLGTYKAKLQAGKKGVVIYGPEGNVAGKPKFECEMILTSVAQTQSIEKSKVQFELSFEQANTPVSTLTGDLAGVFS